LYTRAIRIRERAGNPADTLMAQYRASLAWELRALGQHDSAAALFERALAAQRTTWGDDRPEVATTMLGLASSYHDAGAFDQAEALFERALARRDTGAVRAHPLAATALLNVGMIRRIRQQYTGAEPLIANALAMRRSLYDDEHPAVLEALDQWGALLHATGRYAEAERVVSDALERTHRTLGSEHPTAIALRESLAALLAELGRFTASGAQYDTLLAIKKRLYTSDHPSIVFTLVMAGDGALDGGRMDDARAYFLASQDMGQRVAGSQSVYRILSLEGLARIAIAEQQPDRAAEMLDEASALADTLLRPDHRYVLSLDRARAALLLDRRRPADAEQLLQDIADREEGVVASHPLRGRTLELMAQARLARADTAGAVEQLSQADRYYAGLPRSHPRVRRLQARIASLR
jgi:tetratricopeptide (TPR) repeat protein